MMHDMMGGIGMWGMNLIDLLEAHVLILAVGALHNYLFFRCRMTGSSQSGRWADQMPRAPQTGAGQSPIPGFREFCIHSPIGPLRRYFLA
jgi:hypothetical protein